MQSWFVRFISDVRVQEGAASLAWVGGDITSHPGWTFEKEKNKNKFHMNVTSGLILITIAIYELIMYIYRTMESRYKVKAGKAAI